MAFAAALGGAVLGAILVMGAIYTLYSAMIDAQIRRNEMLQSQIQVLDRQIEEINSLEKTKRHFIARMRIIEKLQRARPEIVHLFDQIVKTVPNGVYLTSVTQAGDHLKFTGVAQSSTRVSAFMRKIDSSQWMKNPSLEVIQSGQGAFGSRFTLDAQQSSPDAGGGAEHRGRRIMASAGEP